MMERYHYGLFLLLVLGASNVTAFIAAPPESICVRNRQGLLAKKGFGPSSPPKRKQQQQASPKEVAPAPTSSASTGSDDNDSGLNAGQKALFEMRRQRAEEKDAELRQVREMLQADQQLQETPAAIPEPVAQRMGKRMLPFVGLPLFLGMGTFVGFWYMATYQDLEFQPALVAASTVALLVVGLLGITYSVMSSSWDAEREGSALGFEEFQKNVENIKEGLGRSRENTVLREKLSGLSDAEVASALSDLERREAIASKRQQTFSDKLNDDLD